MRPATINASQQGPLPTNLTFNKREVFGKILSFPSGSAGGLACVKHQLIKELVDPFYQSGRQAPLSDLIKVTSTEKPGCEEGPVCYCLRPLLVSSQTDHWGFFLRISWLTQRIFLGLAHPCRCRRGITGGIPSVMIFLRCSHTVLSLNILIIFFFLFLFSFLSIYLDLHCSFT